MSKKNKKSKAKKPKKVSKAKKSNAAKAKKAAPRSASSTKKAKLKSRSKTSRRKSSSAIARKAKGLSRVQKFCKIQRVKSGLSQRQLAKKLGYTTSQLISNLERGQAHLPLAKAKTFCKVTGTPPAHLKSVVIADATDALARYF